MFWLPFSIGFVIFVAVFGKLTVEPGSLVSVVGSRAIFSCRTSFRQPLTWHRRQNGHSLWSNAISTKGRPHVERASGSGLDVVVDSVKPEDVGDYQCRVGDSSNSTSRLVVLAGVPNCTAEVLAGLDLGHLLVKCSFGGDFNPELAAPWYDPNGLEFLATHLPSAVAHVPPQQSTLVTRPTAVNNSDDRTVVFDMGIASGRPDEAGYKFNWSSADVVVLVSVRNVRILANTSKPSNCCSARGENLLRVGDQLTCEADGHPGVEYRWEEVVNGETLLHRSDRRLTLSSSGNRVLRCIATHRIRGEPYNASAQISVHVVTEEGTPSPISQGPSAGESPMAYVVLSVSVVLILVTFVIMAFLIVRRCRETRRQDNEENIYVNYHPASALLAEPAQVQQPQPRRILPHPTHVEITAETNLIDDYTERVCQPAPSSDDEDVQVSVRAYFFLHFFNLQDNVTYYVLWVACHRQFA